MLLEDLFDYKNRLMKDLVTNERIVRLLDDELPFEDARSLIYKQIFPYEYVPETIEHGHTFICCDVDVQSVTSKTYLNPTLSIWVFTHKSKLRLPQGGVRTDQLVCEINKVLNGSRYYGLGELNLYSVRRFATLTDFQGKQMVFLANEFNRLSPTGKPIPKNRKTDP